MFLLFHTFVINPLLHSLYIGKGLFPVHLLTLSTELRKWDENE